MAMAGENILVLEDELTELNLLSKVLTAAGYVAITVAEGHLALKACRDRKPDLVLCDIGMPGMNGIDFVRELRLGGYKTPVVVISGLGPDKGREAISAGANAFFSKPVDHKRLLATIEQEIAAARARARGKKRHILIFEDEPAAQRLLRTMLEPEGYRVTAAENGAAALEIFESDPPDLVISDIVLPGIDGIELITTLRKEYNYKAPILVTSGHTQEKFQKAATAAGANAFMSKPVDRLKLLAKLEELLSGRK